MRTKLKIAAMTIALGLSAWSLAAQDAGGPPPDAAGPPPGQGPGGQNGPGAGRHRRPPPPIIAALDTNHDGVVDAAEIANASAALLKLDKNGDGKLTMDELMGPRPDGGGGNGPGGDGGGDRPRPPIPPVIAALDANHDEVLDAAEIANASAVLTKLAQNSQGKLTIFQLMGPPPRHGHGGPDGGPNGPGGDGPGDGPGPGGPGGQDGPPGPGNGPPPPGDN